MVQYRAVLGTTIQHRAVLVIMIQYKTVLGTTVQHRAVL